MRTSKFYFEIEDILFYKPVSRNGNVLISKLELKCNEVYCNY